MEFKINREEVKSDSLYSEDNLGAKLPILVWISSVFLTKLLFFPSGYALFQPTVWSWSTLIRFISDKSKAEGLLGGCLQGTPTTNEPSAPKIWSHHPWSVRSDSVTSSAVTALHSVSIPLSWAISRCRQHGWIIF